ncbi:hypothetical protein OEZ85_006523 [Tetradesmus obliquus]|uniref:Cyclin N-terminal domain-containing protein n=1 Tax=Tetradesmus obliquus TaxID=3088 RepID=A0ABY8TV89_TETOB|nr:hypothetical protein OEZ85_006523 [Tetradesmus obliquus]
MPSMLPCLHQSHCDGQLQDKQCPDEEFEVLARSDSSLSPSSGSWACSSTIDYSEAKGVQEVQQFQQEQPHHDTVACNGPVTAADRASTVDSMTCAVALLQLPSDALFLSVSLLDRCLARLPMTAAADAEALSLLSTACLWIAAKFEQCVVPPSSCFLAASQQCSSPHNRQLLVACEAHVLQALDYRVVPRPTIKACLHAIFAASGASTATPESTQMTLCAAYLCEMSLLEARLVPFMPSQVAAAAFAGASLLTGSPLAHGQLLAATGYSLAQLKQPLQLLLSVHHVLYQGRALPPDSVYATARRYMAADKAWIGLLPSIASTDDPRLKRADIVEV